METARMVLPEEGSMIRMISYQANGSDLVMATTKGLVKTAGSIEDYVGFRDYGYGIWRFCICDAHSGDEAAESAAEFWIDGHLPADLKSSPAKDLPLFPSSKGEAIDRVRALEELISYEYALDEMDADLHKPSEAAFVAAEIGEQVLRIVSYGDCRMLISHAASGELFRVNTLPTWLGPFSATGLRQRISVEEGTIYEERQINRGDLLILHTDGIDEARYEQPTISNEAILNCFNNSPLERGIHLLMAEVFRYGAEDHASAIAFRK